MLCKVKEYMATWERREKESFFMLVLKQFLMLAIDWTNDGVPIGREALC